MENTICVHCGDDCGKYPVIWEGKNFCCHGCKTVYQLLNKNNLYKYYEIEQTPGVRVDRLEFGNKYAYLDNEEIKEKLIEFAEGDMLKVTLYIPSIHCASCIWLLENLHLFDKGIKSSLANFVKKEVSITFNQKEISLRQLVELLASAHYIPQINLNSLDDKDNSKSNKSLLIKIGIAGFAFGNIMLLSMPEYLSFREELGQNFKDFFSILNIILSIPVLLYSSNEYLLSAFKNLRHKMVNIDLPITLGILALFGQSMYEILSKTGPGYLDSFTGFVFFILVGKWYQNKTYQALAFDRDYKSYFPVAVSKITDKGEVSTQLKDLKAGDKILIRNQELIPTDGIIIKGFGNIDYSFVTGESIPVAKKEKDYIYAGGKQIGSAIEIEIKKDVAQSQLTKLWNQNTNQEKSKSEISTLIDSLSKYFTFFVLLIAIISGTYWYFIDPAKAIIAFSSILIVACPCAIALSMPFTFGTAMRIYGKLGFYLKNTDVVERLTHINCIVFDKTGTITYSRSKNVKLVDGNPTNEENAAIKSLARQSTHPLSAAVFNYIDSSTIEESVEDYMEIPSSGIKGIINGNHIKLGSREFVLKQNDKANQNASEVYVSINDKLIAQYDIANKYRHGIKDVIGSLSKSYSLHLISGDNNAEKERLNELFDTETNIHFNQSPNDKLDYIKALKKDNYNVLMVGDGLNDAGALNASNVGISIADDIYQFSPASDAILEASKFHKLVKFIKFSKATMQIVKVSFGISIIYNIVGLAFAVQGLLSPIVAAILMPLSSVSVVAFVTFTTQIIGRKRFK